MIDVKCPKGYTIITYREYKSLGQVAVIFEKISKEGGV